MRRAAAGLAQERRDRRRRPRTPAVLTVAAIAAVALVLLPLAYLVVRVAGGGTAAWRVLGRERVWELVLDTGVLVLAVTAAAVAVAVPLAWLVTQTDLPGRRFFAVAAALPLVIPSYVAALALIAAFGPRGALQRALAGPFGVERVPELYGFGGAFLALWLSTYPYVFLLTAAALRRLDPGLEEAARALGRSPRGAFTSVTLPVLRPAISAGALLAALYTLSDFGAVSLMQYDSLTRAIFLQYRALFDRTPAAVLALVLVALTGALLALGARGGARGRVSRSSPGSARTAAPHRLGRWRLPALAFCSAVVGLALVLPVSVLVFWIARSLALGRGLDLSLAPALNSLLVSVLAALAAVAAALPLAVLAVRHSSPWTRALERLSYLPNALPGLVIALSLVFFAANYASPLYQTLTLLVIAYVVRFFPQALAGSHSALERVSPRLEEAGRSLGRSPARVFASVTAPLVGSGLLAGATLVFLSTMKELPATLLLRPIGFDTLATEIWSATGLGFYSRAAVPALLLIVVSAPHVLLLGAHRDSSPAPGAPG